MYKIMFFYKYSFHVFPFHLFSIYVQRAAELVWLNTLCEQNSLI